MHIKDNRISNFESKEWMNSKVGLTEVKVLVKPQHKDAVNCQASEISLEIYGDFTFLANLVHSASGLLLL